MQVACCGHQVPDYTNYFNSLNAVNFVYLVGFGFTGNQTTIIHGSLLLYERMYVNCRA
jgi:hypothetical protein